MTDGTQKEGHFSGKLYLKGIGDPILSADNYDKIANNLAALGIRKIDGNLVLDDTSFDSIALGPGWMIDDEDKYFEAQISALTFLQTQISMPGLSLLMSALQEQETAHQVIM